MIARRPMAEMLTEIAEGVSQATAGSGIRAASVEVSLPVDVRFTLGAGGAEIHADLPMLRTRTAFDPMPSRLRVTWREAIA